MPAETWRFVGFLPRRRGELEALLRAEETLVAFESPRRVGATLAVLAELDPERPVALCRELTKLHEEIVRGTAAELGERYAEEAVRGEVVLVIGPAAAGAADRAAAEDAVRKLVDAGARPRAAAGVVAGLTGVPANELYAARRRRRFLTRRRSSAAASRRWCAGARADGPCAWRGLHDRVMVLLPLVITLLLTVTHAAVAHAERWQRPLSRVAVAREFEFDSAVPFAAGSRRGVRLAGRPR